jgi:hypothetical protein
MGSDTVFTIWPDGRPGLFEARCALCRWQPFVAMREGEVKELMAYHVFVAHMQPSANLDPQMGG